MNNKNKIAVEKRKPKMAVKNFTSRQGIEIFIHDIIHQVIEVLLRVTSENVLSNCNAGT